MVYAKQCPGITDVASASVAFAATSSKLSLTLISPELKEDSYVWGSRRYFPFGVDGMLPDSATAFFANVGFDAVAPLPKR
ncbi:hypothetical protein P8452_63038 [Trifolium repens]|nr:hypothetical protein P8452_63038 [Trifolium repens]